MVGFYVPGGQLQPHTLPDVGLTVYTTHGHATSSLNVLNFIVGPSPYISVVFGEDHYIITNCVHSSLPTSAAGYIMGYGRYIYSTAPLSHIQSVLTNMTI